MNQTKKTAGAILLISLLTFLSRILGFGREIVLAKYFGLSDMRGAFTVAFKIPNLIRTLLTDTAISAAFIPIFTDLIGQKKKDEAYYVSSSVINISALFTSAVVLVCSIFMPYVVAVCAPGFLNNQDLFNQTVNLSIIIFPTVILFSISGVLVGILNSYSHFTAPSIGPLLWNIIIITVVIFFQKPIGIYSAAWGILIGTFAQFVILLKPIKDHGIKYHPSINFKNSYVKKILKLIFPVTLTLGIININVFVDTIFASLLGPRSVAAIDSAFRIFHLPMGIFAVAIGTVLFPMLSKFSSEMNAEQFSITIENGIGQIFYLTIPFTCSFFLLSLPIVRLVYERGSFTPDDTMFVSRALVFFAIGLPFTSANTLLNRGFYSLKKNWIPLYVGIINILLNAILDWLLMKKYGHAGICFSTALVSTFNFTALLILLQKNSEVNVFKISYSFIKISIYSICCMFFAYIIFTNIISNSFTGLVNSLLLICLLGCSFFIYILVTSLIGITESDIIREMFNKVRGRLKF